MIEAHNLGKMYKLYQTPSHRTKQFFTLKKTYYTESWVLRHVNLTVERGSPVGLIGKNGSGKSTLLQLLCGTLKATEGTVITRGRIAAMLELGSGFNPDFSGLDNIFVNAALLGLTKRQIIERLDDILAFADIGDAIYQPVRTFSSGMVVRLAFSVMAYVKPDILIIDEALSVGDAVFNQKCSRFIKNFSENNCIVFVSHDMNAVASLCDRAILLDRGHVSVQGPSNCVIKEYTRSCFLDNTITPATANLQESSSVPLPAISSTFDIRDSLSTSFLDSCWSTGLDYGNRKAIIYNVSLLDHNDEATSAPSEGNLVSLVICAYATTHLACIMAGYIVKDRLGVTIWGQNSRSLDVTSLNASEHVEFVFRFRIPPLPGPDYVVSVAISEGSPDAPVIMHYKQDIMVICPLADRSSVFGVVGVNDASVICKRH